MTGGGFQQVGAYYGPYWNTCAVFVVSAHAVNGWNSMSRLIPVGNVLRA